MKRIKVTSPHGINTCIQLPSSKSICNRALIINALAKGNCHPENLSDCDDTRVMIQALQHMPSIIDIMAAGTAMRFLTAFLAVGRRHTHHNRNTAYAAAPYQHTGQCTPCTGS